MVAPMNVQGKDIPIELLKPLKERDININKHRGYKIIKSTIETAGLLDPLCVYRENGHYFILDGYLRYRALQDLGIKMVPCQVQQSKEAYTYNRMVNNLSTIQQSRMIRKSLGTIDKKTIEAAFGVKSINYRLATDILNQLHEDVIAVVDKEIMTRRCASELINVTKERQLEILKEMNRTKDYSISLARAMIVKTPPEMRRETKKKKKPWDGNLEKKQQLADKLKDVEKRYDFYSILYRQYAEDLTKLTSYAREFIINDTIKSHLETQFSELLERFTRIIFENGEQ